MSRKIARATVLGAVLAHVVARGGDGGPTEQTKSTPPRTTVNPAADRMFFGGAREGRVEIMATAVDQGARIEARDADARTALMYAAFNGHTGCVQWLLDRGARVGARDSVARTALMFAASGPFFDTVQLLLDHGSNPNDADDFEGWTPLMFAAAEGQLEVVQLLLDYGADPTAVDRDGDAAADHAAQNHHSEVEELLRAAMQ